MEDPQQRLPPSVEPPCRIGSERGHGCSYGKPCQRRGPGRGQEWSAREIPATTTSEPSACQCGGTCPSKNARPGTGSQGAAGRHGQTHLDEPAMTGA